MKIRDSLTGQYISPEEANELTPERYVVETDIPRGEDLDLEELYGEIKDASSWDATATWDSEEFRTITLERVKEIFTKRGLKI